MTRWTHLLLMLLLGLGLGLSSDNRVWAQSSVTTYTVQAGDTLGTIATRYNVDVAALAAANGLDNPNRIAVGQLLIIPTGATAGTGLPAVPTTVFPAQPRQTLAAIAQHFDLPGGQLAALNGLRETARLFPGQPIEVPIERVQAHPLPWGALTVVEVPRQLRQGRTGYLEVSSPRPLTLSLLWNGLPLAATPLYGDEGRLFAPIPVPALLAPGPYPLTIGYTAANGVVLTRTLSLQVLDGGYASQTITLPTEKTGLLDPELVRAENALVASIWAQTSPELRWTEPFTHPIGDAYPTTSPFGTRRRYTGGSFADYHAGQDFGAPAGVPITAPAPGRVALAESLTVRGTVVILDHGRGILTGYWHLSELRVSPGQEVAPGDLLGLVGTTGLSTGNHLHWELRIFGIAVDPMQFLEASLIPRPPPSP